MTTEGTDMSEQEQGPETPDNVQKPPTTEEQREKGEAQQRELNEERGVDPVPYQPGEEPPTNVVENPPQPPPVESDDSENDEDDDEAEA